MVCRWWIVVMAALMPLANLAADDSLLLRYRKLTSDFVAQLESLAAKCEELGLDQQAQQTRSLIAPRTSGRMVYFTADHRDSTTPPATAAERIRQWHAKLVSLRQAHAAEIYKLAHEAAASEQGQLGLRLMYEVVHEDPQHEEARKILGLGRAAARSPRPRAASSDHRDFSWRRGQHWELDSPHFKIESNLSAAACAELAVELEQLHDVWLQAFYAIWADEELVARRFAGEETEWLKPQKFRVVLMKNREEYVKQLSKNQKNVGVSSGIYFDEEKVSILVGGPEAKRSTWHHEVTHQLFQEYLDVPAGVADDENVWLVEAVAQFMESLVLRDGVALLGGYDADALQFARFRARGGDFQMPLAELTNLGREALQEHADIRKIYGQTGGLGHFFMEGREGKLREPFLKSLVAVYQGRSKADTVAQSCRTEYSELDKEYLAFLDVTDAMIARSPPLAEIRGLSLRRTSVTDAGLAAFARCDRLAWLDLSLTKAGDGGVQSFPPSKSLTTLFLERTAITDAALEHVALFSALEELYLSGTSISDAGVGKLVGLKKLKLLDLADCQVTDACIPALAQLKQLESLEVSGTQITPEGLARLKRSLPRLTNPMNK